jgi:hypothetical protein
MVDAEASKASVRKGVWVRLPPVASSGSNDTPFVAIHIVKPPEHHSICRDKLRTRRVTVH